MDATFERPGQEFIDRQNKGRQIAAGSKLRQKSQSLWLVPSQSHGGSYVVDVDALSGTCPDHETRGVVCKHMHAVTFTRLRTVQPDGSVITEEVVKVTTYSQVWPAYNKAQVEEKDTVEVLLKGLCEGIDQPEQKKGRPRLPLQDVIYGLVMKVYTTMSGRRASSDIRDCKAKGHIDVAASYNTLFRYLANPALTPILKSLIEESASPLKAVESQFAVDATGFSTCTYERWFDAKWGRKVSRRQWLKAHAMIGCRTNVVTSIEVTAGNRNDCPEMPGLVKATAQRFDVAEVSADMAYLSNKNLKVVADLGGQAYIPFKSNNKDGGSEQWRKLWHLFWYMRQDFEKHYHQRSNVESAFSMIKRKFDGALRSKSYTAQINEVLCKVLCHNLAVLVHEMHELGVEPAFWGQAPAKAVGG